MFPSSAVSCSGSIRQQVGLPVQCDQEHIKGHALAHGQGDALQREHSFLAPFLALLISRKKPLMNSVAVLSPKEKKSK